MKTETRRNRRVPVAAKNGKADIQALHQKAIHALKSNNGRMPLHKMLFWGLSHRQIDDMLERADCPFRLEFQDNGHVCRPKTFAVLKDYVEPKPVTQAEISQLLNQMTESEYREYLRKMDSSYLARSQRRGGYRKRGISAESYLAQFDGNGDALRGSSEGKLKTV